MQKPLNILAAFFILIVLYAASRYNYLLFHTLAEIFAIVIAGGIFMVAWNTRHHTANDYLLLVGIAYLFIAALDLVHTLSYEGMTIFAGYDANAPTQLWIAARYTESLTLLAAPFMLNRRFRTGLYFLLYGTVLSVVMLTVFHWRIFPDCFLADAGGLTPFKILSEYIICLILVAAGVLAYDRRDRFEAGFLKLLLLSIAATVLSELFFTTYASVFGLSNLLGHYFKIISFYLIYRAVIETGLTRPYDLLFRDLNQHREWLRVTLTSIGDAVIATDTGGRVSFLNKAAETLTGWRMSEAAGKPIEEVFPIVNEETRRVVENPVRKVLDTGVMAGLANHTVLIRKGGGDIPIDDSGAPILSREGQMLGAVLVFRDISEDRRAEAALRQSKQELAVELDAAKHLQHVSTQLIQTANIDALYDKILDTAVTIMHADFASIQMLHPERGTQGKLQLLGHRGFNPQSAGFWAWIHPASRSTSGVVLRTGARVMVPDVKTCDFMQGSQDLETYLQNGMRAVQTTPLISRSGKLMGTLSTHWRRPYTPTGSEWRALDLLARQAADLIDRKRAEEALRTNQERLELLATVAEKLLLSEDPPAVVEEICQLAMAHLECQFFFNYLVEETGRGMRLNACAGIPDAEAESIRQLDFGVAVCGCVARDGERIIAEGIQQGEDPRTDLIKSFGVQAFCCHPLLAQGRLIGTLSFGTLSRPSFTADEAALMKSIADQVAVALQRLQTEKALFQLNATLAQQVAERTELAEARARQLQALAVELIEAEENERREFAHLLHDDLQQLLAAAKLQLQGVSEHLPSEPVLKKVEQILAESIAKSRRLSHQLSPPVLHHAGLFESLQWLSGEMYRQFDLVVEMEDNLDGPLENIPLKRFVFRAVQELLFNTVKHAGVKTARVLLAGTQSELSVTISDQGRGFDAGALDYGPERPGFGLLSIRERASYMGGCLTIDSTPGRGSCFTLRVPLRVADAGEPQPAGDLAARQWPRPELPAISAAAAVTRVLLVDDHQVMRQGLIRLMANQPDIAVVGEAANGREALEFARRIRPDVIVMDISMPEMDGIEATRRIKDEMPGVRVIGLSMHENDQVTGAMRVAGAETLISKTDSSIDLLAAISGVLQDQAGPYKN